MSFLKNITRRKPIFPYDFPPAEPEISHNGSTSGGGNLHPGRKPPFYFYIILFLIPVLLPLLLEFFLNISGYGKRNGQWVEVIPGKLMLNPEIARRYFYCSSNIPRPMRDLFNKEKSPNSFRVFILGESSAAGFPYLPTASFSRYLERRLKAEYPSSKIEVVNLSIMAVNSFAFRDLMPGVLQEKPDLILIYAGHNEYYGALGAASTLPYGRSRQLKNLMLYLERFKTVQLLSDAASFVFSIFRNKRHFDPVTKGLRKELEIPFNSASFLSGVKQFEDNMQDILSMACGAGVPVILGTLVCNLKDQPPFFSAFTPGFPLAEEVFIEAEKKLKEQDFCRADSLFRLSRDLDLLRFRAPEEMNSIIRHLAHKFSFAVVKFDSVFNSLSSSGITGNEFMADHLHPNVYGHQMMGELFFEKMKESGTIPKTQQAIAWLNKKSRL